MVITPSVMLIAAVNVLPALLGFYTSLRAMFFFQDKGFVGLQNYLALLADPATWAAIGRSLAFTFGALAVALPLATGVALVVRSLGTRGQMLLTMLLVPWAMSPIVVALIWKWILVPPPGGLLAAILMFLGVGPASLLSAPDTAFATVIGVAVWRTFAFAAIVLVAGLAQIPDDLYRAAAVDGLSRGEAFRRITLPLLMPSVLIVVSILTISYFNEIQVIIGLTNGGPLEATTTLAFRLYQVGFVEIDQGRGNAIAVLMFLINLLLLVAYIRVLGERRTGDA